MLIVICTKVSYGKIRNEIFDEDGYFTVMSPQAHRIVNHYYEIHLILSLAIQRFYHMRYYRDI